jgi:DNA polymerase-3 subunit gamma/tau
MAKSKTPTPPVPAPHAARPTEYTVVARRYRPQQFTELIGQEHVAAALVNALQSDRVAHAYLFTGARGVGKTSAARILAKALNCVKGPTPTPCDQCANCQAIAAGDDVDVSEIDGASNNKVEEIRDLRQNVGFRPAHSRYKIYIIDEVHMLTTSAFNALLKTLEEPPPHVKFILATTEVQKIPITILSRCQRFDFAHVGPAKIFEQLKRIVEREGHSADDDALRLIARRANGSMRDSQSLLDQLLAACPGRLTADQVTTLLGLAPDERVSELAAAILKHDPRQAFELLNAWVDRGLQIPELVDQLIGYWRVLMLVNCGGPEVRDLPVTPTQLETVLEQARSISLDTILAGLEVWTATRARLRDSTHAQVLLEMAIVRLCRLEELLSVGQLVQMLTQAGPSAKVTPPRPEVAPLPGATEVKKNQLPPRNEAELEKRADAQQGTISLTESNLPDIWHRLIAHLTDRWPILANHLKLALAPAIFGPNSLEIRFPVMYNYCREACATETNVQRIQEALRVLTGQPVAIRLETVPDPQTDAETRHTPPVARGNDQRKYLLSLPLFKKATESLGAQLWHVDDDFNPTATPRLTPNPGSELETDET